MKRKILLSVISIVFCLFAFSAVCSADVSGDYTYTVTNGEATITAYNGAGGNVNIPSKLGDAAVTAIGGKAFEGSAVSMVFFPASVTVIGEGAFANCEELTIVSLSEGLTTIKSGAFLGCKALSSLNIPASVTSIGDNAFAFCDKLQVTVKAGNTHFVASSNVLYSADMTRLIQFPIGKSALTEFAVPDTVTTIDENAFYGAKYLKSITISDAVVSMSGDTFVNCPALATITVGENNTAFSSVDGNLFNKAGTVLIQYAPGKTAEAYTVPSGVTAIDDWAFGNCDALKSVIIADTVEEIGYAAFANCDGITAITIPGSATIKELAFGGCTALETVEMTDGVVRIGMAAFSGCTSLKNVTIPASVTAIGEMNPATGKYIGAFGNCTALENFVVSENNPYFCSVDGSLFNKSVTEIVKYAVGKADTAYAIPATVSVIASEAFAHASNLENILLPSGLIKIEDDAFRGCTALTSVKIPEGVTYIGLYAFADCTSLASATVPSTVNFIGAYAFSDCTSLTLAKVYTQTPVIGVKVFSDTDSNFVLRGHAGSSVEEYAAANAYTFKDIVYQPEITVDNLSDDILFSAPAGGWVEGENTFTLYSDTACLALVSYDGGDSYTRLSAVPQADGGYSFTANNVVDGVIIKITKVGDVNCDGVLSQADATRLKAAVLGKIELSDISEIDSAAGVCLIDINGDGKFSNADVTRLKAMVTGKVQPKW